MVRILVADDRELIRTTLGEVIRQAEPKWHVCGEAANGREAIDKALELAPDLIILDIAMPVLDGIGAAKAIRAQLPDVPILIYTFMAFAHLELMAKQAGAQAVVQKGDLRALIGAIRRVLAATSATAGSAADGDGARLLANSTASAGDTAASSEMDALQEETTEAASSIGPAMNEAEPAT